MPIFDFLSGLISPVTDLVGKIVTKDEDQLKIKAGLMEIQTGIASKMMDYESQLATLQKDVIVAEAQGSSWLQRNWRPLLMLSFIVIIANNYILAPYLRAFGLMVVMLELPPQMWTLIQLGVGGYIGGRTLEKVAPAIGDIISGLKKKDEE